MRFKTNKQTNRQKIVQWNSLAVDLLAPLLFHGDFGDCEPILLQMICLMMMT